MTGDFDECRSVGDNFQGTFDMVGLSRASQLCAAFNFNNLKLRNWVGCRLDGANASQDAATVADLRQKLRELSDEITKLERIMQDFYYEIQDPKYDPTPQKLAEQKEQLAREEAEGENARAEREKKAAAEK